MQSISDFVMDLGLQLQYLIHVSPVFQTQRLISFSVMENEPLYWRYQHICVRYLQWLCVQLWFCDPGFWEKEPCGKWLFFSGRVLVFVWGLFEMEGGEDWFEGLTLEIGCCSEVSLSADPWKGARSRMWATVLKERGNWKRQQIFIGSVMEQLAFTEE